MNYKLIKTALLSTLIIALYGYAPVYLLNDTPKAYFYLGYLILCALIFVFWIANILIQEFFKLSKPIIRYFASYFAVCAIDGTFYFITSLTRQYPENSFYYALVTGLTINTIILIIINSITIGQKKQAAEEEVQQLLIKNMEARQLLLMQQLQPHFLFNALSTLKSLIKSNADEAENFTMELSEFLRYSVQSHNNKLVTLEQELDFTNNYIKLQKVRFGEAIEFSINISDELFNYQLPVYGLQLLVENAIKHNAFSIHQPLKISINTKNDVLIVANNKNEVNENNNGGIGLSNLNERYKMIVGKDIEIINTTHEFRVYMNLLKP